MTRHNNTNANTNTASRRGPFPPESVHILTVPPRRGVMNHSYRDYSQVPPVNEADQVVPTSIDAMTFAQKVHSILSDDKYSAIISWMPHGRAFRVHQPAVFEREICPKYFQHGRYSSFLRALNNYGFKHLTRGPDRNCE